jgi:hypothetical protein
MPAGLNYPPGTGGGRGGGIYDGLPSFAAGLNANDYRNQVETAISAQRALIAQVSQALQRTGVLTPDEAARLNLNISIEQDDERKASSPGHSP